MLPVCNRICLPVHHIQSAVGSMAIESQTVSVGNSNYIMSAGLKIVIQNFKNMFQFDYKML